jgi:hypothetical protein
MESLGQPDKGSIIIVYARLIAAWVKSILAAFFIAFVQINFRSDGNTIYIISDGTYLIQKSSIPKTIGYTISKSAVTSPIIYR